MFTFYEILDPVSVYAHSFLVFHHYVMFFLILTIVVIVWLLKLGFQFFVWGRAPVLFRDSFIFSKSRFLLDRVYGYFYSYGYFVELMKFVEWLGVMSRQECFEVFRATYLSKLTVDRYVVIFVGYWISYGFYVLFPKYFDLLARKFMSAKRDLTERGAVLFFGFVFSNAFSVALEVLWSWYSAVYEFFCFRIFLWGISGNFVKRIISGIYFYCYVSVKVAVTICKFLVAYVWCWYFRFVFLRDIWALIGLLFFRPIDWLFDIRTELFVRIHKCIGSSLLYRGTFGAVEGFLAYRTVPFFNPYKVFRDLLYSVSLDNLSTVDLYLEYGKFTGIYDLGEIYRFFLLRSTSRHVKFAYFYRFLTQITPLDVDREENFDTYFSIFVDHLDRFFSSYDGYASVIFSSNVSLFFHLFGRSSHLFLPLARTGYFSLISYHLHVYALSEANQRTLLLGKRSNGSKYDRVFWLYANRLNYRGNSNFGFGNSHWLRFFLLQRNLLVSQYYETINNLLFVRNDTLKDSDKADLALFGNFDRSSGNEILRDFDLVKDCGLVESTDSVAGDLYDGVSVFRPIMADTVVAKERIAVARQFVSSIPFVELSVSEFMRRVERLKTAIVLGYLDEFDFFSRAERVQLRERFKDVLYYVEDLTTLKIYSFFYDWYYEVTDGMEDVDAERRIYFHGRENYSVLFPTTTDVKLFFPTETVFFVERHLGSKIKRDVLEFEFLRKFRFFCDDSSRGLMFLSSDELVTVFKVLRSLMKRRALSKRSSAVNYYYSLKSYRRLVGFYKHVELLNRFYLDGVTLFSFRRYYDKFFRGKVASFLYPKGGLKFVDILRADKFFYDVYLNHSNLDKRVRSVLADSGNVDFNGIEIFERNSSSVAMVWRYLTRQYRLFEFEFVTRVSRNLPVSGPSNFLGVTDNMREIFLQRSSELSDFGLVNVTGAEKKFVGEVNSFGGNEQVFNFFGGLNRDVRFLNDAQEIMAFYLSGRVLYDFDGTYKTVYYRWKDIYSHWFKWEAHIERRGWWDMVEQPTDAFFSHPLWGEFDIMWRYKSDLHHSVLFGLENVLRFGRQDHSRFVYLLFMHFRHQTRLEWFWTIVPALILAAIAIPSLCLLYLNDRPVRNSNFAVTFKAVAHQWYWDYSLYSPTFLLDVTSDKGRPLGASFVSAFGESRDVLAESSLGTIGGGDVGFKHDDYYNKSLRSVSFDSYLVEEDNLNFGQHRLLEVDNRMLLPSGLLVRGIITSADVLHSWALPAAVVKVDAVPGRLNQVLFMVKTTGVFYGQCSELCGVNHGFMPIVIEFIPFDLFVSL